MNVGDAGLAGAPSFRYGDVRILLDALVDKHSLQIPMSSDVMLAVRRGNFRAKGFHAAVQTQQRENMQIQVSNKETETGKK